MNVIDSLIISLGIDSSDVKKGMEQAENTMQGGISKIGNLVKNIAAPIAGAFAAGKIFDAYVNGAASLDRLSKSLGMDIERLQEWQGAARTTGVEAEEIGNIFRDMNDYITDAVRFDSGPLKDIAAQLGISLTDVNGTARNSEQVLLDLADAFQSVGAQEATGYGMQLSFDPGMIALLQQGRTALEDLFREQRELGIYTKEDAEIATRFNRGLDDLWQSIKTGGSVILRIIVPAMTVMTEWITRVVKFLHEHEKFVEIFFIAFATAVTAYALPALAKLAASALTNPFTLLIAGAAALALALEDLYVWMNGGEAAFGDFWSMFGTPEEVKASVEKFMETLKGIAPILAGLGAVKFGGMVGENVFEATKHFSKLRKILAPLGKGFTALGRAALRAGIYILTTVVPAVWSFTTALLANPITWVVAGIAALIAALYLLYKHWDLVKEGAKVLWNGIVAVFSGIADWFGSLWTAVVAAVSEKWQAVADGAGELWRSITGAFSGIAAWFGSLWAAVVAAVSEKWQAVADGAGELWQSITAVFSGAVEWFGNLFAGVADAITAPFTAAFDKVKSAWSTVKGFFGFGGEGGASVPAAGSYIAPLGKDAAQAISPAAVGGGSNTYNSDTSVSIGKVEVQTQATDADGISRDIGKGLRKNVAQFNVNQANLGVVP